MGLLEEGMIFAVKNFGTKLNDNNGGDGNKYKSRKTKRAKFIYFID
jgi:hypothetical protein